MLPYDTTVVKTVRDYLKIGMKRHRNAVKEQRRKP